MSRGQDGGRVSPTCSSSPTLVTVCLSEGKQSEQMCLTTRKTEKFQEEARGSGATTNQAALKRDGRAHSKWTQHRRQGPSCGSCPHDRGESRYRVAHLSHRNSPYTGHGDCSNSTPCRSLYALQTHTCGYI